MAKVEIHFHTRESSPCGKVPAAEGVAVYGAAGYDGIVITDHFSRAVLGGKDDGDDWSLVKEQFLKGYRTARQAGQALGIRIYLGMEIRFPVNDNDYLVYGADEGFFDRHPWVYESTLEEFYKIVRQEQLCVIQAHPFRAGCVPADPAVLDGAEWFNGHPGHDSKNHLAQAWIRKVREQREADGDARRFVGTAGSDYHQDWHFTGTGMIFPHLPENEQDLKEMILMEQFTRQIPE